MTIESILNKLILHFAFLEDDGTYWGHDTGLGDGKEEKEEAKQALKKEIKACIGEDEKLKSTKFTEVTYVGSRNSLRAEIRANIDKLFGETDPVDSGK